MEVVSFIEDDFIGAITDVFKDLFRARKLSDDLGHDWRPPRWPERSGRGSQSESILIPEQTGIRTERTELNLVIIQRAQCVL